MLRNSDRDWGAVARCLHWSLALLILAQFALGWIAVSWRLSPTKLELFVWHKSIGLVVLVLALARIAWRLTDPAPLPPPGMPRWERLAARGSHLALYALMLALPLSGWVINSASNVPFLVFGWFPLPDIAPADEALSDRAKQAHLALVVALALLVIAHVGAALRHHFVRRDDVLARMLPRRGPAP